MPPYRTRTCAAFSDIAAEQKKIHHFLDGGDGVLVLRQSHRPTTNDALGAHRDFSGGANLFAREAADFENLIPRRRAHVRGEFFEPGRVLINELSI